MKEEYTLVVVDMQPDFAASRHPLTLNAVEREVRAARRRGCPVVVLQIPYFSPRDEVGYRPTHERIMRHLASYRRKQVVEKLQSDGSYQVIVTCARNGFTLERFRVCGVNTDICVLKSVQGLSETLPACRITVVADACNSSYEPDCLPVFRFFDNVAVELPAGPSARKARAGKSPRKQ